MSPLTAQVLTPATRGWNSGGVLTFVHRRSKKQDKQKMQPLGTQQTWDRQQEIETNKLTHTAYIN